MHGPSLTNPIKHTSLAEETIRLHFARCCTHTDLYAYYSQRSCFNFHHTECRGNFIVQWSWLTWVRSARGWASASWRNVLKVWLWISFGKMIMPKSQCRFRRSKLLPSSVLILFTIIGQIFAQNTFKSIQLRLQICSGQDIGDDEQKDIILKSFLGNIPILGENSSLEIVPR